MRYIKQLQVVPMWHRVETKRGRMFNICVAGRYEIGKWPFAEKVEPDGFHILEVLSEPHRIYRHVWKRHERKEIILAAWPMVME